MKKPPDAPARPEGSQPEILVTYKPAGRETLDAITDELVPLPVGFERQSSSPEIIVHEGTLERDTLAAIVAEATNTYAEPTADAPTPMAPPAPAPPVAPAAIVSVGLRAPLPPPPRAPEPLDARPASETLQIFEMLTYVVRGADTARLSSEALRRAFVEEYLLARLPVRSMAEVERVDVTPWTVQGTLVVRVWCRTDASN